MAQINSKGAQGTSHLRHACKTWQVYLLTGMPIAVLLCNSTAKRRPHQTPPNFALAAEPDAREEDQEQVEDQRELWVKLLQPAGWAGVVCW